MNKITLTTTGKSLNQLYREFGQGNGGFYSHNWKDYSYADDVPKAGTYELDFTKRLTNKTYAEQKAEIPKGWDFPHPAIVAEAVFKHFKYTGERLLEDWYTRTSRASDGYLVDVGEFRPKGASVLSYDTGSAYGLLGVVLQKVKSKGLKLDPFDNL